MYYPGQVVHDLDNNVPVQCGSDSWQGHPAKRTTHYLKMEEGKGYVIALPATVEWATNALKEGIIQPAPIPPTHCPKCMNWKSNCSRFKTCERHDSH